jgi:kinetochore protein Spc25, fungi type
MKHRAIEILSQKSNTHNHTLAKEAAEANEMQTAIAAITEQRDSRAAARDALKAEIVATRKAIGAREEAQRAHAMKLAAQAQYNNPELEFWTGALCMDIEGAGKDDHLRFVFTHIEERDWEREAWFELCTERKEYEITETKPPIENEKLEAALEGLNETRDLGQFLKSMRGYFVEAMKV